MAISLKNIGDRVTVLESRSSAYNVDLANGTAISNNFVATKPGVIIFYCNTGLNETDILYIDGKAIAGHQHRSGTQGHWWYMYGSSFVLSVGHKVTYSGNWFITFYPLKLYYNFSYNIIYKILSSIKFKISQIISSLKTTRR